MQVVSNAVPAEIPPLWVRICHWTNASLCVVMLMSGWQIYNADPFWGSAFPPYLVLGGGLPGALLWHFAGMWFLVINGLYAIVGLAMSGRFHRLYLLLNLGKDGKGNRSRLQKLAYLGVIALMVTEVLSGLSIWKPVQLQWLTDLFGGYQTARHVHFVCMSMLALFLIGHASFALMSPKLLLAMVGIKGRR